MPIPTTLLDLPAEIVHLIAQFLDFPSLIRLRISCRCLYALISPLTHNQMMEVEVSDFGMENDLYTCRDCLRLRPRAKFADKMVKKRKAKFAVEAMKRFCVECGINPRPGTTRYTYGSHIVIQGELYVICPSCRTFRRGVLEGGRRMSECQRCWSFQRGIEQRAKEHREREERAKLRAERISKRAKKRELWGSESEDSEDEIPPSPTWSEIQMGIVQAEANLYMNSPKAGSE